jgi:hypothetical protein
MLFLFPPEELMNKALGVLAAVAVLSGWLAERGLAETGAASWQSSRFAGQYKQISSAAIEASAAQVDAQFVGISRVPKFGFHSTFGFANGVLGEHITEVRLGSVADRMGLAAGDVIIAVNGQPLRTAESWYDAVQRASERDGWVTLKIVERRSGSTAYRTANLFKLNSR